MGLKKVRWGRVAKYLYIAGNNNNNNSNNNNIIIIINIVMSWFIGCLGLLGEEAYLCLTHYLAKVAADDTIIFLTKNMSLQRL